MNGAPSHIDTFDPKPALTKYQRHALQGQAGRRLERPADRQPDAVAVRVSEIRPERAGNQQPVPAYGQVRRRPLRDSLDVHRHGGACLRLPADEHRQRRDRQAEPGLMAELRPGLGEREPAQLRRHDRSARRPDQRRRPTGPRVTCRPPTRARSSAARARRCSTSPRPPGTIGPNAARVARPARRS